MDTQALLLSFHLASVTTAILLPVAAVLGWWLTRTRIRARTLVVSVVTLPLVLPPTVLGFYLLAMLGAGGPLASLGLAFTFAGLVLGSLIFSLPFALQPLRAAYALIPKQQLEVAASLGAPPWRSFLFVVLPQCRGALTISAVLSFAHTLGEFGVVLMIGGAIPGETKTASIAIFEQVEQLKYEQAHATSAVLLLVSLMVIYAANLLERPRRGRRAGRSDG